MPSAVLLLAREMDAPDRAVIATRADGSIIYWGPGAEALYGWTEAEVLGQSVMEVTPADLSREEAGEIMRTLGEGDPWSGEFLVRTRDGNCFNAHVTDIPVHDSTGRLLGIVGVSRRAVYMSGR